MLGCLTGGWPRHTRVSKMSLAKIADHALVLQFLRIIPVNLLEF